VPRRNDAAGAKGKSRIDRVNNIRLGDRVDFIHPNDLRVTSEVNFVAAPDYVQVPDSYVIINFKLLDPEDQVEVPNLHIVADTAFARADDAQSDAHPFSNFVSKKQPVTGTL
jgi:hypothetical protein